MFSPMTPAELKAYNWLLGVLRRAVVFLVAVEVLNLLFIHRIEEMLR